MTQENMVPGLLSCLDERSGKQTGKALQPAGRLPLRLSDLLRSHPAIKTRDLIAMLLGIGARARRASLPKARVNLRVYTPSGRPAVRISLP